MSYLLDKKNKRKKWYYVASFVFVFLILFYFRVGVWNGLALVSHVVFRPVLIFGNTVGGKFGDLGSYFVFKNSLYNENQDLRSKINESEAKMANYGSILAENISLKEILGRKNEKMSLVLASILSKPNQSLYDTLVIDVGTRNGIQVSDMVFALGDIPLGRVSDVYPSSSKVILFSNPGQKTEAIVSTKKPAQPDGRSDGDVFLEVMGRGGGNFEMIVPRDFEIVKGDEVVLPGINPFVLGIVETIISDPRDPFTKALLTSPVNIQELKFVQVEI